MSGASLSAVLDNNRFDEERLARYLRERVAGFDGPIDVMQFQGGQSNPTYRITTPGGDYVLRKRPAGNLVPSAHQINREYRIMKALEGEIPVPRMLHLCEDDEVIGQAFYLMEHVNGRVVSDARLIDVPWAHRRAMGLAMVEVLARLHSVDFRALGLEDYGRPSGYLARQVARWSGQYAKARVEKNSAMDRLIPWLDANLPHEDESAIVHGDYRSYNIIFSHEGPRVLAVLDWELSTIGHPLADLAYFCLPFHLPQDDLRGLHGERPEQLGLLSEDEIKEAYCRATGRDEISHWRYLLVFSLFRSAAIRAGVFKRAHDGTATDPKAYELGKRYRGAAARAWALATG